MKRKVLRDTNGPYMKNLGRLYRPTNRQTSCLNKHVGESIAVTPMDDAALEVEHSGEVVNVSWDKEKGYEVDPGVFQADAEVRRTTLKQNLMAVIHLIDVGVIDAQAVDKHFTVFNMPGGNSRVSFSAEVKGEFQKLATEDDFQQFARRQMEYWMELCK